jgi:quercetin dioxygenase-like cupin family protein
MRRVVTGVDGDGRSTVLEDGPPPTAFAATSITEIARVADPAAVTVGDGQALVHQLWAAGTAPLRNEADPTTAMEHPEFDTPAGATSWIITDMGPHLFTPMHDTQTIDYGLVVRGELTIGLETGSVLLHAGDAVFVDGVLHSWTAGPEGCTIATVQVGLARP